MKRIICLALIAVLLFGMIGMISISAFAEETVYTASDACVAILKEYEGFTKYPVWD